MNYLITPPSTHYDGGIGITGCDFRHSAETLKKHISPSDGLLPLCYLHRHAIELFLKSVIFILHKKYIIEFGDGFSLKRPGIKVRDKWIPMDNTHNLSDLYTYFEIIFDNCKEHLPDFYWDFPGDVKAKVDLVSGTDPSSTFYRYPNSGSDYKDMKKSKIQKISLDGAFNNSKKPAKLVLMLDENDNIIETYNMDADALSKTQDALDYLSDFFYGVHATFRGLLTDGS
ncbi:MAG: hypothetical protein A2023_00445 [Sulfuricurvum sp. GWF2_44_89]|uniref:Uncharacterized protein n=1 Tax=Sulfuricurvum kujiense TaxID=148813 RepID=A0A2D3WHM2_9BACT|nr:MULTISPECIES: hypothetical protein [Sulfuricurvum]OHD77162.1 MAG: hypothetical protein A2023_00445 [Sulfuricurvum sp. GWF2_44_89]OHD92189.1 MAG: hypothetical protein A2517_10950 [Sulfuricurvum sp. RIFOXYD12_FULL_44_77]OHD99787.1 MAG: hypothetical protein A2552_05055 [Sulfuricurvum sp. RIFOXYD2_FULL_44_160]DAB38560.1 MAG TPA: hypothetical protein CFH83_05245 [Sulfuricurvum kujiense]